MRRNQKGCNRCDHEFHMGNECEQESRYKIDGYGDIDGLCHCNETLQYESGGDDVLPEGIFCGFCGTLVAVTDFDTDFADCKVVCLDCIKTQKNDYFGCPSILSESDNKSKR